MSVYCVPRPETALLSEIGDAKRLLLVGCPMCANLSAAVQNDVPAYVLGLRGLRPAGIDEEVGRMARSLRNKGASVYRWRPSLPGTLCGLGGAARHQLRQASRSADVVVTLGCESGEDNVRAIVGNVPVVGAMTAKGLFAKRMKRGFGKVLVDKSSLRILPFTLGTPDRSTRVTA